MKRFLIHTSFFSISILLIGLILFVLTKPDVEFNHNDYMLALADKHQRASELGTPKIIFAGGSNIAFNIDSKRIEEEFNLPVVNLGLNIGLGIEFILNELNDIAEKDDIVFLSMTYFQEPYGMYSLRKHTSELVPKTGEYFRFELIEELTIFQREFKNNVIGFLYKLTGRPGRVSVPLSPVEHLYVRSSLNEYGDFVAHHNLPQVDELDQRLTFTESHWDGIEIMNSMLTDISSRGYHIYYLYPAYPKSDFQRNRDAIYNLHLKMKSDLKIPILGEPETFTYDDSLFFDTAFHLGYLGKKQRTDDLIELIKSNEQLHHLLIRASE